MGFRWPRNQVRNRLSAGGRWIRTIGTPQIFLAAPSIPRIHLPQYKPASLATGTDGPGPTVVRVSPGGEHLGTPAQQLLQGTRFRALALPTAARDSAVHFTLLAASGMIGNQRLEHSGEPQGKSFGSDTLGGNAGALA